MNRLLAALLLCFAPVALARPPAPDDADAKAFADALARMKTVSDGITEYSVTFYKREWVNGTTLPQEVVAIRFRRPWDIVMQWVGGNHMGRTLLYKGPDWNGGRFVIDPGPMMPVLSLAPESSLARSGGRHSIYDLPMTEVIAKFVRDAKKVADSPTWTPDVKDEGMSSVRGEPTRCFLSKLPKDEDPTLYAAEIRTCISPITGLPNMVRTYEQVDGELILVEEYDYVGLNLSPGFTDSDFDREKLGL